MTDEFTTQNLIKTLDLLKQDILDEKIDLTVQKDIWDLLYWEKNNESNKKMLKYLFLGWWIYNLG
jgi:hypothetical protein